MLPKNLLVPLIGLGLYTQANNLNLCNNTAMMIIVLALILEQKEIEDISEDNNGGDTYNSYNGNQYTNTNQQATATFAQPVYSTVPVYYNSGYNTCGCHNGYNGYGYGYSNCGCNNGYNGYGYSNCGCNGYRTYNNGYSTCNSCNSCNNGYYYNPYYNRSSNICGCGTTIY